MNQKRAEVKEYLKGTLEWALTAEGQKKIGLDPEQVSAEIVELQTAINKLWVGAKDKPAKKTKTTKQAKPEILSVTVSDGYHIEEVN